MDLLERDSLLDTLKALLAEAADGHGHVVLLAGEAGIGKTSLVATLREHRGAARLWWGACDALQTPHPLAPLHDIARDDQVAFRPLLAGEPERVALFESVLADLQRAPTLLVVEDVHWADEATLDLLKFLGRRIDRLPCLLVVTYRDDEIAARHPLRRMVGELPPLRLARLKVPPLSSAAVEAMARRALRSPDGLHAVTQGNPFFVTELLQHGVEGVPQGVQDLVLARYARLGPHARAVMDLASIMPRHAERWLVDALLAPPLEAIEECLDSGLLVAGRDMLSFRHELARVAVEQSLSALRAQDLHARVLARLIQQGDGLAPLARLVHHANLAGDAGAVLRLAPQAASEARGRGAHREAAAHLRTAFAYAHEQPDEVRAGLLDDLAYEDYLTDRIDDALAARAQSRELWRRAGDALREGDAVRWLSRLSWYHGRTRAAERHADEALAILQALPPGRELAMALSNRAQLHMLQGQPTQAVAVGRQALALAQRLGAREIEAHALNNIGSARLDAGDEGGREELGRSLALSLAEGYEEHAARAYVNLAYDAVICRRLPAAMDDLQRGIAYCESRDLDAWSRYLLAYQAEAWFVAGDWARAAAQASRLLQCADLAAISRIAALAVLGHVGVRRGEPQAQALLDEALALALPTHSTLRIGPVVAARMEAARLRGDDAAALAEMHALDAADDHSGYRLWIRAELAYQQQRAGARVDVADGFPRPFALQLAGDWRAAAQAWRALGCVCEEARALAEGDDEARREALAAFERLGADAMARHLRRELQRDGVRGVPRGQRASTQSNPQGLTRRELEVLRLLCGGLRNAQIAARLSRSVRTVDHHVAAIFAKLGVNTRSEAVAAAIAAGVRPQN